MHLTHCRLDAFFVFRKRGKRMRLKDGREVVARRYEDSDAEKIVSIIHRNFREVNVKDYGVEAMETLITHHDVEWFKGVASYASVYTFCIEDEVVAVGSISSFWGSLTESILLTIFVIPELHGQGVGRFIIETLEQDELFLRAERIEIPASITAVEFYRKQGYDFKNGIKELDDEGHFRLEKFRRVC